MKKLTVILFAAAVAATAAYNLGPKPATPLLASAGFSLPSNLHQLESELSSAEKSIPGMKPGCEARIVWADSLNKSKTRYAFLYLHGGTSSHAEADPLHRNIARRYGANIFLARLAGHGLELGDATLGSQTADDFAYSAEHALAIAKKLGDEVVVMGTSFGGALSTWLASRHPEIKAAVLFSPCIKTYDERTEIFIKPWGLDFIKLVSGAEAYDIVSPYEGYDKLHTTRCNLRFIAEFQSFLTHTMKEDTFKKVKCPVFMGYWYKNELEKDTIAAVPAMLQMFEQLSSPRKQKLALANAGNHAIANPQLCREVDLLQKETEKFLDEVL